jgi:hypothetical protein
MTREGLQEYQTMPSLRDVAHEGVRLSVHKVINQPQTGASAWCGPKSTYEMRDAIG